MSFSTDTAGTGIDPSDVACSRRFARLLPAACFCSMLLPGPTARASLERIEVDGGVVEMAVGPKPPSVSRQALRAWVVSASRAVSAWYGRLPVPLVRLRVVTGRLGRIGFGTTWGGAPASIRIAVGRHTAEADLADDWVLTHEMVHLGLPDLASQHAWMEEGLATYVEPLARARIGAVPEERAWRELAEGLPQGLPGPSDGGLDDTTSWGRTYWGGALFWLMADVEIRERTGNRRGLDDALRGILAAGGNVNVRWAARECLETGDRATGVPVLAGLYGRMARVPLQVDLTALLQKLGVVAKDGRVTFDDAAPQAEIRKAIVGRTRSGAAVAVGGAWKSVRVDALP